MPLTYYWSFLPLPSSRLGVCVPAAGDSGNVDAADADSRQFIVTIGGKLPADPPLAGKLAQIVCERTCQSGGETHENGPSGIGVGRIETACPSQNVGPSDADIGELAVALGFKNLAGSSNLKPMF